MQSKEVSKLLPYLGIHSRCYCFFKGEEVVQSRTLPRAMTKLSDMLSFDKLDKTNVVFLASKTEDQEATARAIVEVTSWMDWRTYSVVSLDSSEAKKVKRLIVAGTPCWLLVVKTALTI